jgi:predicted nucleic acid-binding protein
VVEFWDASAIVPLLVPQASTPLAKLRNAEVTHRIIWWSTRIEVISALARLAREARIETVDDYMPALEDFVAVSRIIEPTDNVAETAIRLVKTYTLKAADAQQLAAAIIASDYAPERISFLSFDDRLNAAARQEGFKIAI